MSSTQVFDFIQRNFEGHTSYLVDLQYFELSRQYCFDGNKRNNIIGNVKNQ